MSTSSTTWGVPTVPTKQPAVGALVLSVCLHPTEPLRMIGLSSGELCIYTARAEALAAMVEMDALSHVLVSSSSSSSSTAHLAASTSGNSKGGQGQGGGSISSGRESVTHSPLLHRQSPPPNPSKVLQIAKEPLLHCVCVAGREEDIVSEVIRPLLARRIGPGRTAGVPVVDKKAKKSVPKDDGGSTAATNTATATAGDAVSIAEELLSSARHLVVVITAANAVHLVDIENDTRLLVWDPTATAAAVAAVGMSSTSVATNSPLHPRLMVTQVANYGALLFITVAERSHVEAMNAQLLARSKASTTSGSSNSGNIDSKTGRRGGGGGGGGTFQWGELLRLYSTVNRYQVYVFHLAETNPFLDFSKERLDFGKGACAVAPRRIKKQKLPVTALRVHPFAPVLLTLTDEALRVYCFDGSKRTEPHVVLERESASTGSASNNNNYTNIGGGPSFSQWAIDADFLPTSVVIGHSTLTSASAATTKTTTQQQQKNKSGDKHEGSVKNLEIAVLTRDRICILDCSRAGLVEERAFYVAPKGGSGVSNVAIGSGVEGGGLCFERLMTWLGSPSSIVVQYSNCALVEYGDNDTYTAVTRVLTVRSIRRLPSSSITGGESSCDGGGTLALCTRYDRSGRRLDIEMKSSGGGDVRPCVPLVPPLPLWALMSALPAERSGEYPNATIGAYGEHRVIFSRLINESHLCSDIGNSEEGNSSTSAFVLESIMADVDTVDCSAIRFTAIMQRRGSGSGSGNTAAANINDNDIDDRADRSSGSSDNLLKEQEENQKATDQRYHLPETRSITVGRLLQDSPLALHYMEHGFYYVGGRQQPSAVFLVSGLVFSAKKNISSGGKRQRRIAAGLLCVPASPQLIQRAATRGDAAATSLMSASAVQLLLQPPPFTRQEQERYGTYYDVDGPKQQRSPEGMEMSLLNTSFQLSNDGVAPCIWALWAHPQGGPVQLVMHSFFVAEDRREPIWRTPQRIHVENNAYANPTQVFSLPTVCGSGCTWATSESLVGQLFLYYEESNVLVLATVEQGSRYIQSATGTREAGAMNTEYQMSSNNVAMEEAQRQVAQENKLRLVPQAAVELTCWPKRCGRGRRHEEQKRCNTATAGGLSVTHEQQEYCNGIKISATVSTDGVTLLVAVTSRLHGFAVLKFPVIGHVTISTTGTGASPTAHAGGGAGASTRVQECILFSRSWEKLAEVKSVATTANSLDHDMEHASSNEDDDNDDNRDGDSGGGHGGVASVARRLQNVCHTHPSPLHNPTGTTACNINSTPLWTSTLAPVSLLEWVYLASQNTHGQDAAAATSRATAVPFLAFQRHRTLYVAHLSGAVVPLCPALMSGAPVGVAYAAAAVHQHAGGADYAGDRSDMSITASGGGAAAAALRVRIGYGDYAGLLSQSRRNRQAYEQHLAYQARRASEASASLAAAPTPGGFSLFKGRHDSGGHAHVHSAPVSGDGEGGSKAAAKARLVAAQRRQQQFQQDRGSALMMMEQGSGAMCHMDITETLRTAVLKMQALIVSEAITKLITSSVMLSQYLRDTFMTLTQHLQGAGVQLYGDYRTAEVLSTVPLASVTYCIAHEVRSVVTQCVKHRRKEEGTAGAEAGTSGGKAKVAAHPQGDLVSDKVGKVYEQWWMLLVRTHALVSRVNPQEAEDSHLAVLQALQVAPEPVLLARQQPQSQQEESVMGYTAPVLAHLLIYCPFHYHKEGLWSHCTPAVFQAVLRRTMALLGASGVPSEDVTTTAKHTDDGGDDAAATTPAAGSSKADSASLDWMPAAIATIPSNGGEHWRTLVFYDQLRRNIKSIADAMAAVAGTPCTALSARCAKLLDADAEFRNTVEAVLDVAAATVSALQGTGYGVSGQQRERMDAAVAASVSHRVVRGPAASREGDQQQRQQQQQQQQQQDEDAAAGEMVGEDEGHFSQSVGVMARLDVLRNAIYTCHWRCLYDASAYPSKYTYTSYQEALLLERQKVLLRQGSAAAAVHERIVSEARSLPSQVRSPESPTLGGYPSKGTAPRASAAAAGPHTSTSGGAVAAATTFRHSDPESRSAAAHAGEGAATNQQHRETAAAPERPTIIIEPQDPDAAARAAHAGAEDGLHGVRSGSFIPTADAISQMLASEEARMRDAYFNAFSSPKENSVTARAAGGSGSAFQQRRMKTEDSEQLGVTAYFERLQPDSSD